MLINLLRSKDEMLDYFKIYNVEVEKNQLERKIKSPYGGEYFLILFDELCEEHGIIYESTPPYSSESIGIANTKKIHAD